MKSILIVSSYSATVSLLKNTIESARKIASVSTIFASLETIQHNWFDFILIDYDILTSSIKNQEYQELFQQYWEVLPDVEIIVLADKTKIRDVIDLVKIGISDYLTYPLESQEIKLVFDRINSKILADLELNYLRDKFWRQNSYAVLQTKSPLMHDVFTKVRQVAPTDSTVLITGETGTGKGVIANLIHQHSERSEQPFINLHCGAIPETLLESELFGHEKGAFTGAIRKKLGKFELANNGTLFLDEIGTISPALQIKLLKVLEDRNFQRVGGEDTIHVDIRIIIATNSDLLEMVKQQLFREDLFYRLNVFEIELPPLRERTKDIPALVDYIIKKLNKYSHKNIQQIEVEILQAFQMYDWPGNIRELENVLERAFILSTSNTLFQKCFPEMLFGNTLTEPGLSICTTKTLEHVRQEQIDIIEQEYLEQLLRENEGKIKKSAAIAGIGERQFNNLMKKYNLKKEKFKN